MNIFLPTANNETDVRKIADWYGWQVEEDNNGQLIIYTDIPEGAPQVAQVAAACYGWDYDSDNLGSVVLFTGVYADEQIRRDEKNGLYPDKCDPTN